MWVTSTLPRPPPRHHHPRTRAHPTDPITFVPSKAWGLHQAREAPGGRAPHPPGGPGLSGGFTGTGLQEGTEGGSAVARLGARDRVGPGGSPHPFPAPAWEARARVAPEGRPSGVTAGSSRSPMAPHVPAPFALWPSGASNGPSCPASHLLPGKWEADLSHARWGPGKGLHHAAAPRPPQSPAQWRGRGAVTTHPGCVG